MSSLEVSESISNTAKPDVSSPSPIFHESYNLLATIDRAKAPGRISAVIEDVAQGAVDELVHQPLHLAEQVAIGAGIAAGAALLAPEVGGALGAAALGAAAYGLYENAGSWFKSAAVVSGYQSSSPEATEAAHAQLRRLGADATELAAASLGGGFMFGRLSAATTKSFFPDSPFTPPPGALRAGLSIKSVNELVTPPSLRPSGELANDLRPTPAPGPRTREAEMGAPKMGEKGKDKKPPTAQGLGLGESEPGAGIPSSMIDGWKTPYADPTTARDILKTGPKYPLPPSDGPAK
jgi:hypothetical protein